MAGFRCAGRVANCQITQRRLSVVAQASLWNRDKLKRSPLTSVDRVFFLPFMVRFFSSEQIDGASKSSREGALSNKNQSDGRCSEGKYLRHIVGSQMTLLTWASTILILTPHILSPPSLWCGTSWCGLHVTKWKEINRKSQSHKKQIWNAHKFCFEHSTLASSNEQSSQHRGNWQGSFHWPKCVATEIPRNWTDFANFRSIEQSSDDTMSDILNEPKTDAFFAISKPNSHSSLCHKTVCNHQNLCAIETNMERNHKFMWQSNCVLFLNCSTATFLAFCLFSVFMGRIQNISNFSNCVKLKSY